MKPIYFKYVPMVREVTVKLNIDGEKSIAKILVDPSLSITDVHRLVMSKVNEEYATEENKPFVFITSIEISDEPLPHLLVPHGFY